MVGVGGLEITATLLTAEVEAQDPLETVTEKLPLAETVMLGVVAPLLQVLPVGEDEVNMTEPPWQKVRGPEADMVGVAGDGFTVTATAFETAEVQPATMVRTVKLPVLETVML
jgi:hypothetical protein